MMTAQFTLGVITNNRHDVFQRNVIAGIEAVAAHHHYNVVVESIAEDPAHPRPLSFDMAHLDGVLVIANILSNEALHNLYAAGKPITLISHQVADMPIPAVITNNRQGMEILMHHLVVECGRRKIVFIRGDMRQTDAIERDQAFQREVMRYNLDIPDDFILEGDFIPAKGGQAVAQLLTQHRDFDAVLAADYLMALSAMDAIRDAGLQIPEAVMVAGFGDGVEAETPGLTTVAADVVEQGRRGARQLIGQIKGLQIRGVTVLNTNLIARQTTRRLEANP